LQTVKIFETAVNPDPTHICNYMYKTSFIMDVFGFWTLMILSVWS